MTSFNNVADNSVSRK